ncbi:VTT domain-containing protein [Enterobacter cloacae subsp. cloacae]|nr:VTT domain-containing protein [Enterobacter cloacae subsp. cloacae]
MYAILFLILFCETGLVVTPFLPGIQAAVRRGALSALPGNDLNVHIMVVLMVIAAIVGDAANYTIDGSSQRLFSNPGLKIFRRSYLDKPMQFYERHGWKNHYPCAFCAYWCGTFAPFVAGMGHMSYRHFAAYNVIGAAVVLLLPMQATCLAISLWFRKTLSY